MQECVVAHLQLPICAIKPFKVSTGSGEKLLCDKVCRNVQIKIQGVVIVIDLFLLPMDGANIVISTQWLKKLGDVVSNYKELYMKFFWKGEQVIWKGISWLDSDPLSAGQLKSLEKSTNEAFLCYLEVINEPPELPQTDCENSRIYEIVNENPEIFDDPHGLPPHRDSDHFIHLQPNSVPVNVRPYRYPQFQKEEIEKLVKELLLQGTIKPSTSPYSSPVLLVKKKMEVSDFVLIIEPSTL